MTRRIWLTCLVGVLATAGVGQDEGEWDPSGESMRPTPGAAAKDRPKSIQDALAGIQNAKLKAYVARLAEPLRRAAAGEYEQGAAVAEDYAGKVSRISVTQPDTAPRAILTGLFLTAAGELRGLAGNTRAGQQVLAKVDGLEVPDRLKAEAHLTQAWLDVLDFDFGAAVAKERRARSLDVKAVQPVIEDGVARLYRGDVGGALSGLKALFGKGTAAGQTLLYAGAAALAAGRQAEAATYLGRGSVREQVSYLPTYYLITGLLAAADGKLDAARQQFADGAQREHGRYRPATLLLATADMALGQKDAAQALLNATGRAPAHYQAVAQELLVEPSANRAAAALKQARYWLDTRGYVAGTLSALPAGAPPGEQPAASPPAGGESPPAQPDAGLQPAAPTEAAGLPPAQPPTGAAGEAAPGAAPVEAAEDTGVESLTSSTAAAQAYSAAVELIRADRLPEAEAALRSALRMRGFAEAWLALGQVQVLRGQYGAAADSFGRAVAMRPGWPDAVYSLAWSEDLLGHPAEAARLYRAAVELGLPPALAAYARQRLAALLATP